MAKKQTPELILALDIGTSSTRALLYDSRGRMQPDRDVQIKYAQRYTEDGGVESNAYELLQSTLTALKRLLRSCTKDEKNRIAVVSAACFSHGLLGIDAHNNAVTPLYSWADTRSRSEVTRLHTALDAKAYHQRTGAFLHSSYWPAKILWLRQSQPEVADKVKRWVSFSDYIALHLSGHAMTSVSMASGTGLFNESDAHWDEKTLKALSLEPEMLPEIAVDDFSFTLKDQSVVPALGDIPWHLAYGDGACSNIGAGGVDDTRIVVNVSTSGAIRVLCPKPDHPVSPGLFRYRLDKKRYVIGGALSNGGNIYAWMERTLQLGDSKAVNKALADAPPDGHGLTVLPFWAGERSPGWHSFASGSIVGLNLSTSPIDIMQAGLESVAFTLRSMRRDLMETFPVATQIIVSGGAVEHSKFMQQLLADVLGAPVRMSLDPQPSGRGAALAASERLGLIARLADAPDRLSKPIQPQPEVVKIYEQAHARFEVLYGELIGKPLDAPTAKTEERLQSS